MARSSCNYEYQGLGRNYSMFNFSDKDNAFNLYLRYFFDRTRAMFEYKNLPDTIPERSLELFLQMNGFVCFTKVDGSYYVFTGGLGGPPDPYYMPTICTVANPALNFNKTLKIDEECVIIPSDSLYRGLFPLFAKYASALVENDLSMWMIGIKSRIVDWVSAPDGDRSKASVDKYVEEIVAGKFSTVAEENFFENIKVQPSAGQTSRVLTDLIEYEQYLKASCFNEIGLNANYNMKRESLNSAESQMNNDALLPLVDDMLNSRREALEKINKMYGLDITVDFASSWKDNEIEIALEHEEMSAANAEETSATQEESEVQTDEQDSASDT